MRIEESQTLLNLTTLYQSSDFLHLRLYLATRMREAPDFLIG